MVTLAQSNLVTLRRLSPDDLVPYQAYRNDPEVGRYQDWKLMTDEEALGFLTHSSVVDPLMRPGCWAQIAVASTATGALLGDMGLFLTQDGQEGEVGITLARAHHRQGVGSAAMRLAFGLIWDLTQAQTIRAWADQRNIASVGLLGKVGMTHLGVETSDVVEEAFALQRPDGR